MNLANRIAQSGFPEFYTSYPTHFFSTSGKHISVKKELREVNSAVSENKKTIHIILADDDDDDRDLFMEAVEELGLDVRLEMAEDGGELLKMLKRGKKAIPDILFLDLNMPSKNGIECLMEIRKAKNLNQIPVVIYSTSSSINDIEDTFKEGANLYISKPTSFKELLGITRKVISINWNNYKPNSSRNNFVFPKRTK